jgi:hypothetical protein
MVLLLFNACKKELKITAPYKEMPQVYAIVTPQERTQMIRINKIFLGEGDANPMAKVPDSVNYKAGELSVWLERYVNGNKVAADQYTGKTECYFRDSLIQTEEGAFSTTQRVYLCNDKLFDNGVYKLTIRNTHTGNIFTATTTAIDSVAPSALPPFTPPYFNFTPSPFDPPSYYVDYGTPGQDYTIRTKAVNAAYMHDLTIRIHFYDSMSVGANTNRTFDYVFFPQLPYQITHLSAGDFFVFNFKGENIYAELASMLARNSESGFFKGRRMYRVDFLCYAATQEYYDFLQFSAPSLNVAQEKTLYSNFKDKTALGIFTFRSRSLIAKRPAAAFMDQFAVNKNTCQYNFFTSYLTKPGCQ